MQKIIKKIEVKAADSASSSESTDLDKTTEGEFPDSHLEDIDTKDL